MGASQIDWSGSIKSGGLESLAPARGARFQSKDLLVSWKLNRLSLDILLCLCLTNEIAQGKQHIAQDAKERDGHYNSTNSDIIDRRGDPVRPGRLCRHGKWRDSQPDTREKEQEQHPTSGWNKSPEGISYMHYASLLFIICSTCWSLC